MAVSSTQTTHHPAAHSRPVLFLNLLHFCIAYAPHLFVSSNTFAGCYMSAYMSVLLAT